MVHQHHKKVIMSLKAMEVFGEQNVAMLRYDSLDEAGCACLYTLRGPCLAGKAMYYTPGESCHQLDVSCCALRTAHYAPIFFAGQPKHGCSYEALTLQHSRDGRIAVGSMSYAV